MTVLRTAAARRDNGRPEIADDVEAGLTAPAKSLPPTLFYDAIGSELYERITELPEYYPTRTERAIFERHGAEIVEAAARGTSAPLRPVELGAGTATKTQFLLRAILDRQGRCDYLPIDVSEAALAEAAARLAREQPEVRVRPLVARHRDAYGAIAAVRPQQFALFIGSSIGNFDDDEATQLLSGLAASLRPGSPFLLGTDMCRDPEVLIPAYDDAQGVTAEFDKNVLARINRELGGEFDLDRFRHVARWNAGLSRVEMHLESLEDQTVPVTALGLEVSFRRGETIHTESSVKYDLDHVDALLGSAGFERERTFTDPAGRFGVHLARRRGPQ